MPGIRTMWLMLGMMLPVCAGEHSGRASAEWISVSSTYEPGKPLQTAFRLTVDDGWHTYWLNPGEGGMKTSVSWELPAGWSAEMAHPVPSRFRTGELACFGYKGEVLFPVTLMAPADSIGAANLKARISWLTCNDDSCVPGDAELALVLDAGPASLTADAEIIRKAVLTLPRPQPEWMHLEVTEKPESLVLAIGVRVGRDLDLRDCEAFPATPNVIDPGAEIRFGRSGGEWLAVVPKSEYASTPVRELVLVLARGGLDGAIELRWQKP